MVGMATKTETTTFRTCDLCGTKFSEDSEALAEVTGEGSEL